MKFLTTILSALTLFLTLTSCGGKKGKTDSSFKVFLGSLTTADMHGGFMVYGKNDQGHSFGVKVESGQDNSLDLPNGLWDFYAIGWDASASHDMSGDTRCAVTLGQTLAGGEENISLTLSRSTCTNTHFGNNYDASNDTFSPIKIGQCDENQIASGYDSSDCNGAKKGYMSSYKILLPTFFKLEGVNSTNTSASLKSDCLAMAADENAKAASNFISRIPFGSTGGAPIKTIVRGYLGSENCGVSETAQKGVDISFSRGNSSQGALFHSGNNSQLWIQHTPFDICDGNEGTAGRIPFAGGQGDGRPYLICSVDQWNAISQNFGMSFSPDINPVNNSNFKILKNLDFLTHDFFPIGEDVSSDPSGTMSSYTGRFYGNKKVISNIFHFDYTDKDKIGVFREIGGSANIHDLKIKNAYFHCKKDSGTPATCSKVGLLAGSVYGGGGGASPTIISNIKAYGFANGYTEVGGLIGSFTDSAGTISEISNSHFIGNVEASGSPSNVGGILGYCSNSLTMTKTSAHGDIYADAANSGGIVGMMNGANCSVTKSTSSGTIRGSRLIGGLVGKVAFGLIQDSYSKANIVSYCHDGCSNPSAGGAVGYLGTSAILSKVFHSNGFVKGNTGSNLDNQAYVGGLVGYKLGACTNSIFTGPNNTAAISFGNAPTTGKGCGSPVIPNVSGAFSLSTYTSEAWDIDASGDTGKIWYMPDGGYDVPRLTWEVSVEEEIPTLKRACSGSFGSTIGTGTMEDPQWICTKSQFNTISSGSTYYKIQNDIDFRGPAFSGNIIPPGEYHIDGNFKSLSNISLNATGYDNVGIFASLDSGSFIKNFRVNGISIDSSGDTISAISQKVGTISGVNEGVILQTGVKEANINLIDLTISGGESLISGGLVGENTLSGLIQYTDVEAFYSFSNPAVTSSSLMYGGIVGKNDGDIKSSNIDGGFSISIDSGVISPLATDFQMAGVTSYNAGMISKVSTSVRMDLNNNKDTMLGFSLSGVVYQNDGTISDVKTKFRVSEQGPYSSSNSIITGIANLLSASSRLDRVIASARDGSSSHNFLAPFPTTYAIANTDASSANYEDVFCFYNDDTSTDHGLSGCNDYLDNASPDLTFSTTGDDINFTYTDFSSSTIAVTSTTSWSVSSNILDILDPEIDVVWSLDSSEEFPSLETFDPSLGPLGIPYSF